MQIQIGNVDQPANALNTQCVDSRIPFTTEGTLFVELAFVFVQCRESLYDGNVASHVVTKDWLVDSNESKYPIQESNYSFLSACQRRQKKMLSVRHSPCAGWEYQIPPAGSPAGYPLNVSFNTSRPIV